MLNLTASTHPTMKRIAGLSLSTILLGAGITLSPWTPAQAATAPVTTITTTGTTTYSIPAGVTKVKVELWGAQGGARTGSGPGGFGAKTTAILDVCPGGSCLTSFDVVVGGVGGATSGLTGGSAGLNGGGAGADGYNYLSSYYAGGGGGGATDIRTGAGLATRLVVAGGGGGRSGYFGGSGGQVGGDGNPSATSNGLGATQSSGGAGGTANTPNGGAGTLGIGGAGGAGTNYNSGGAGGGGGYYGGGGGSANGGGGGGSSIGPDATSYYAGVATTYISGSDPGNAGNGKAIITAFPNAPLAPTGTPGNTQNTITVTPASTGGVATSYQVTQLPGGATCTPSGSPLTCTFTSLTNGTSYTYTATASNTAGTSAASAASAAVIPVGPPSATSSTLSPASATLGADGVATQVLTVQAKDAAGNVITTGGATVTITRASGSGTIGTVTDNGNGTYTATVTAPASAGSGTFVATLNASPVKGGGASQSVSTLTYSPSAISTLASLTMSHGTFTPAFSGGTTNYTSSAILGDPAVSVTPTVSDPLSTVTVNGVAVVSGTASSPMTLVVGTNTFALVVTAQDGTHQTTYNVTITVPDPIGPPPPAWFQSYALFAGQQCTPDWGASWAEWAVPFSGGPVCNRVVYFTNGDWWVRPGFAFAGSTDGARLWR